MKLLFVGSEALPFVSSGGLGDVMGALPKALKNTGKVEDVRVMLPLYAQIGDKYRSQMTKICSFTVDLAWRKQYCGLFEYSSDGVIYYFIDNEYYFKRQSLYGSYDDGERYAFFCKAVLDALPRIGYFPDILHCHDWQVALCIIYLERQYKTAEYYRRIKTVYTVHNIEYQGIYGLSALGDVFGLSEGDIPYVEYDGCINLAKGAIFLCDKLTTVSPKYAEELRHPYFGKALAGMIDSKGQGLQGILNGIDTSLYDPSADGDIAANFSAASPAPKKENKLALQRVFGLPESPKTPIVAMVSRLVGHKGFDLVRYIFDELMQRDLQFVLLGTGEADFEAFFIEASKRYPQKASAVIAFDKGLAKQVYAGADIFLMPSRSEPCGLAQMIASRYGTVPVVRETGGLYDTIKPYFEKTTKTGRTSIHGNGFTFQTYNAHDMLDAIDRTLSVYGVPEKWDKLVRRVMKADFSWNTSAEEYVKTYSDML